MSDDRTQKIPTTDPAEPLAQLVPGTEHPMDATGSSTTDSTTGSTTTSTTDETTAILPAPPVPRDDPSTASAAGAPASVPSSTAAAGPARSAAPPERPGVRVGTVVWGLVVAALGVGLIALASGVTFDVELAVIVLVAAAGVALLVGSLATSLRRRDR